jgi:hypothetical protein
VQDYGLYLIDKLLSHSGRRLHDWDCTPQIVEDWGGILGYHLIVEQMDDLEAQDALATDCIAKLN